MRQLPLRRSGATPRGRALRAIGLAAAGLLLSHPTPLSGGETPSPAAAPSCSTTGAPAVEAVVLRRLEVMRTMGGLWSEGERIRARVALPDFYARRGWSAAWIDGDAVSPCARTMLELVERAPEDGLEPEDYHAAPLRRLFARADAGSLDAEGFADLEFLLTDAFMTLGSHLSRGRVNPTTLEAEWLANRRQLDMAAVLAAALADGSLEGELLALRPPQPEYARLRTALATLRRVEASGGWGEVPEGPTLRRGDQGAEVEAVRRRLRAGGDLMGSAEGEASLFDDVLAGAVARFQERHGLEADSAVGARTRAAMNVPVALRIAQLEINMERWRWLPDDLGQRHIRVNIADYRLEVRDRNGVEMEMRAVVGRNYRQTPSFSASMTYLVLAPYWHVPPGIAANDKLPELRRDIGYLARQRMTLLRQATNEPVDPSTVDYGSLTGSEFNRLYRLRQDPGPLNALGRVKFMFPNRHNVYIHDTPSRELFSRRERAFSSGCIRVQNPLDLAALLLNGDPRWPRERINAVAEGTTETTVRLAEPVPVHLLYWTAFVDDEGRVHFRPDIYQRDTRVRSALVAEPPEV